MYMRNLAVVSGLGRTAVWCVSRLGLVGLFTGLQRHCVLVAATHYPFDANHGSRRRPTRMGTVANAVMFHAQLHKGLRLLKRHRNGQPA
jgi:hypothetical protein